MSISAEDSDMDGENSADWKAYQSALDQQRILNDGFAIPDPVPPLRGAKATRKQILDGSGSCSSTMLRTKMEGERTLEGIERENRFLKKQIRALQEYMAARGIGAPVDHSVDKGTASESGSDSQASGDSTGRLPPPEEA